MFDAASTLKCFPTLQAFNAIDQYTLLVKLSTEIIATPEANDEYQEKFQKFINTLSIAIEDKSLPNLSRLEPSNINTDSLSSKLTTLYETEKYEDLIRLFVNQFHEIETPLAFVNLIAKAVAITNPPHLTLMPGLIYQLIESLANLYKLSAPPNQIEDKISAIITLLHNFTGSNQLQLCLYKSMPLRYTKPDWMWLSKTALITTTESTPLAKLLATEMDPLSTHKYLTNKSLLPLHRTLRSALQESSNESNGELLQLQKHFHIIPLPKDFFESVSAYYIRAQKFLELIELCACTLAKNPNAYIAFPMKKIIDYIEQEAECSLNSVIIVYYYVKKVDSTKDYLLNETYEEFFGINGTSRPSELLEELDIRDDRALGMV